MTRVRTMHPSLPLTASPSGEYVPHNETESVIVEEQMISIFLMIFLLASGIFLAYLLHIAHVKWLHESGALLLVGMTVGAVIKAADEHRLIAGIKAVTSFNTHLFFIVLLPPVIFDSGYNSNRRSFFGNFLPICLFAFIGTIISALCVASIMYAAGVTGACYQLTIIESLVYGSLISATDTVTVLSVFGSLNVTPFLYSIVFGESALNDAVAIVLFRTFTKIEAEFTASGAQVDFWEQFIIASSTFSFIFLGSMAVGILIGVLSALFFKHIPLRRKELQHLELQYTLLFPYMAYFLSEGVLMSGIVAVLFCGFTMAHYTRRNLSQRALRYSTDTFRTLAQLSETFVFIYVGMAIFTGEQAWSEVSFGWISIVAILVGRLVNVFPLTFVANRLCTLGMQRRMTFKEAIVLWYTGLRGGMAYALSLAAEEQLQNPHSGLVMQSATLMFVLLSIFGMGGSLGSVMVCLGLTVDPVEGEHGEKKDHSGIHGPQDDDDGVNEIEKINLAEEGAADDDELVKQNALRSWFLRAWNHIDTDYLSPFLSRKAMSDVHLTAEVSSRASDYDSDSDGEDGDNKDGKAGAGKDDHDDFPEHHQEGLGGVSSPAGGGSGATPHHGSSTSQNTGGTGNSKKSKSGTSKPMPPSPRVNLARDQTQTILARRRSLDAIDNSKKTVPVDD